MTIDNYRRALSLFPCVGITAGALWLMTGTPAGAQLTQDQINDFRNTIGNRVEAATILGGDYGVGGGAYNSGSGGNNVDLSISKFGGMGDIYPIKPLGDTGIGWQPQLQGNMGYLTAKKTYSSTSVLNGDQNEDKTFAIQFGGGVRFWFDDHFSIAPTFMGMYGHTENNYTATSAFALAPGNLAEARQLGLIDYIVNTWTVRPAVDFQYQYTWNRTIFTFSSDPTYFYTEAFSGSSGHPDVNGNSVTWQNKIDVDVPLGVELWGHELRSGGYFSRTEFYDGIRDGLNSEYMYDVHPRIVMDFLGELWKVKWLGIGGSYMWGNDFHGWSIGVDAAFRF
jgi:hypothetical protein